MATKTMAMMMRKTSLTRKYVPGAASGRRRRACTSARAHPRRRPRPCAASRAKGADVENLNHLSEIIVDFLQVQGAVACGRDRPRARLVTARVIVARARPSLGAFHRGCGVAEMRVSLMIPQLDVASL